METLFMNTKNTKRNESHKFILNMSQMLDFRSSNGHVTLPYIIYLLHKEKYNTTVQMQ